MPITGVYPLEGELVDVLYDTFDYVDENVFMSDKILSKIFNIRQDYFNGVNEFICRARYQAFLGRSGRFCPVDLPEWDEVASEEFDICDLEANICGDYASTGGLFFSSNVPIFNILDSPKIHLEWGTIIRHLLKHEQEYTAESGGAYNFLAVADWTGGNLLHVVRSTEVADRGPNLKPDFFLDEDGYTADGTAPGNILAYVLPEEILKEARVRDSGGYR